MEDCVGAFEMPRDRCCAAAAPGRAAVASVSVFPAPSDRPPRIMGIFAHPDDEVFCLGGTMARYVAAGGVGKLVSLTRGEAGQIRDVRTASRRTLGEVRARELELSAKVLGVGEVECHHFRDGALASLPVEPLIELAVRAIDEFRPDVVISFGPDGAYGHPDHIVVSGVATVAAERSETNPVMLHSVFPRRGNLLVRLLVDWLGGLDERFRGTEDFAHGLMLFADGSSMLGYAADHLDVRFYPAGSFIIEQGEPPGELFLVLSGEVDICLETEDGTLNRVGASGPGSFVGEEGMANGRPRNAHVVARTSVTCFVLSPGRDDPTAGRGASALTAFPADHQPLIDQTHDYIEVDIKQFAGEKVRALACHRSQYAISADMFPPSLAVGLFGFEYFTQAGSTSGAEADSAG